MFKNHGDDLTQREVSQFSRRFDRFPNLSTIGVTDQSQDRQEDQENFEIQSPGPEDNPNRPLSVLRRELILIPHGRSIFGNYVARPLLLTNSGVARQSGLNNSLLHHFEISLP